jgi:N-sulfoglucosamine sulfohydrolase
MIGRTFIVAMAIGAATLGASAAQRPNILLFLSDDHGWADSGCYGHRDVRTPHIDRLAAEGLRFTHAFAGSATCSPSRAVIYSGLMPFRNGAFLNHSHAYPHVLTLPHHLQSLGYRVALANKTHYGPPEVYPFEYLPATLQRREDRKRIYRTEGVDTAILDAWLAEHVSQRGDEPFCLVVAASGPHVNWQEVEGYDPGAITLPPYVVDTPATRQGMARYFSDITATDAELGRMLESLERHGLADSTLAIYTSDQGAEWPFAKWNLYDAGIRVPLIVRWPGKVRPGAVTDAMVSLCDLLPTFIQAAGEQPPEGLDGRGFLPVLLGESREHRHEIYATHSGDGQRNDAPMRAIRTRTHKLIFNLRPENKYTTHFSEVMDADHGLIWTTWQEKAKTDRAAAALIERFHRRAPVELYDLRDDPLETRNLAEDPAHAPWVVRLSGRLKAWMAAQGDRGVASEEEGRRRQDKQIEEMRARQRATPPTK